MRLAEWSGPDAEGAGGGRGGVGEERRWVGRWVGESVGRWVGGREGVGGVGGVGGGGEGLCRTLLHAAARIILSRVEMTKSAPPSSWQRHVPPLFRG